MHILKITLLEDRIVYDGAVAHSVIPPAAAAAASISSTPPLADHPPPEPQNVLVISDKIANFSFFERTLNADTKIVKYNPDTTSLDQLSAQITQVLDGQRAGGIGIVTDGAPGKLMILSANSIQESNLTPSLDNQETLRFFENLSKNLIHDGTINFFGSNIGNGPVGLHFLQKVASVVNEWGSSISIQASSDPTGSALLGGDWVLETSVGIQHADAYTSYFSHPESYHSLLSPHLVINAPGLLTTTDSGGSSTFDISLSDQPTADVTVTLALSDAANGHLSVTELTFNRDNWNVVQAASVNGVDDGSYQSRSVYQVEIGSTESADPAWSNLQTPGINVVHIDNFGRTGESTNLLIVSSALPDLDGILSAVSPNTRVVIYDPVKDSLNSLAQSIADALDGNAAANMAFATDGRAGFFNLLESTPVDNQTLQNPEMIAFWNSVVGDIAPQGHLDLLGCAIGATDFGSQFLTAFNATFHLSDKGITLSASTDATGSSLLGGNWIMERSETGLRDVSALYFDQAALQGWSHVLPVVPNASIGNASINEGNAGTQLLTFTVTLDQPTASIVTIDWITADNTALAGYGDYVAASGVVTFQPNETTQTVSITVNGDVSYEPNETFFANLSNAVNATITTAQGTGTIFNDDTNVNLNLGAESRVNQSVVTPITGYAKIGANANGDYIVAWVYSIVSGFQTVGARIFNSSGPTTNDFVPIPGVNPRFAPITVGGYGNVLTYVQSKGTTFDLIYTRAYNSSGVVTATGNPYYGGSNSYMTDFDYDYLPSGQAVSYLEYAFSLTYGRALTTNLSSIQANIGSPPSEVNDLKVVALSNSRHIILGSGSFDGNGDGVVFSIMSGGTILYSNIPVNITTTGAQNQAEAMGDSQGNVWVTWTGPGPNGSDIFLRKFDNNGVALTGEILVNQTTSGNQQSPVISITTDDRPVVAWEGNGTGDSSGVFTRVFSSSGDAQTDEILINTTTSGSQASLDIARTSTNNDFRYVWVGNGNSGANSVYTNTIRVSNSAALPTLTVNDVTVTEGDSGTTLLTFTVTRNGTSALPVTFNYSTADNSATTGDSDYNSLSGSGSIASGGASATTTVSVVINGDTKFENNETFFLNLTSPTNATISDSQGVGTIVNDDAAPTLTINDVSYTEGNSGTTIMSFTVTRTGTTALPVTFNFATADGTATSGDSDYVATSGAGSIAAGGATGTTTVNVTLNGDVKYENNENLLVNLSGVSNATVTDSQGVGTITNDDALPILSISNISVTEGDSGTKTMTFTITRTGQTAFSSTFNYATADGTALVSDGDYQSTSGSATIAAGGATASTTISVTINGDIKFENDETFLLNLSSPGNSNIGVSQATGTILNDDAIPTLSIGNVSISEGDSGTKLLTFTVTRTGQTALATTFNYATADGTATIADSDYAAASGSGSIAAGGASATTTLSVIINGDTNIESDETFAVNLTSPSNGIISTSQGIGTILNDDNTLPLLYISDVSVSEGNTGTTALTFTVTREGTTNQTVTFNYSTADGTATTADNDYQADSGVGTIAGGGSTGSTTITVFVNGDLKYENNQDLLLNISNALNATITDSQGSGLIVNDDPLPVITVNDVTVTEGNSGTTLMTFTITRSGLTDYPTTVDFATSDGTATIGGSDYQATSGTATISTGGAVGTATVTVAINGDIKFENNETLSINLSNPTNAAIGDALGLGNILNDDPLPTIRINDVTTTEGNSGTTTMTFTVTRTGETTLPVNFDFATADNTANAPSDYIALTGSGTIAAGGATATTTITVTINGDTQFEPNENYFVNLSNTTNAVVTKPTGVGTISNDDMVVYLSVDDISVLEGDSGTSLVTFTVTRTGFTNDTVTFSYASANGTATMSDYDYTAASSTGSIAGGGTSATTTVSFIVKGDVKYENDETFVVNLSNPAGGLISDGQGVATIVNDDAPPSIAISNTSTTEGNNGTTILTFTVTSTGLTAVPTTVHYTTLDGTATAADYDYQSASGDITLPAGSSSTTTISIVVKGDTKFENDESFVVQLSNANGGLLTNTDAVGTILNDDALPTISVNDVSITASLSSTKEAVFTIALSNPTQFPVYVTYGTNDGTATVIDGDYLGKGGVTFFAPGQTRVYVPVIVNPNLVPENTENFSLFLSDPSGAQLAKDTGQATILNPLPQVPPVEMTILPLPHQTVQRQDAASVYVAAPFVSSMTIINDTSTAVNAPAPVFARISNIDLSWGEIVVTPPKTINVARDTAHMDLIDDVFNSQFEIYLTKKPTAPVTIYLQSDSLSENSVSPKFVVFTPENWNNPQEVNVTYGSHQVNDTRQIDITTLPAVSADPQYNEYDPKDVTIPIVSEEHPNKTSDASDVKAPKDRNSNHQR